MCHLARQTARQIQPDATRQTKQCSGLDLPMIGGEFMLPCVLVRRLTSRLWLWLHSSLRCRMRAEIRKMPTNDWPLAMPSDTSSGLAFEHDALQVHAQTPPSCMQSDDPYQARHLDSDHQSLFYRMRRSTLACVCRRVPQVYADVDPCHLCVCHQACRLEPCGLIWEFLL